MPSYQQLDFIADSYIPLLLLITLVGLIRAWMKRGLAVAGYGFVSLLASITVVYGVKAVDDRLGIWPAIGMDYSTHTAMAWVFVVHWSLAGGRPRWIAGGSMAAYVALMLYQQYHTLVDVLSTSLVVLPPIVACQWAARRR